METWDAIMGPGKYLEGPLTCVVGAPLFRGREGSANQFWSDCRSPETLL